MSFLSTLLIPTAAAAQSPGVTVAASFVETFNEVILFPLITLMIAVALLTFVYGGFEFITNANNSSGRETGRKHMLFGIVGMLVMLSALAILSLAANTFGLGDEVECANNPAGPGCAEVFRLPDPGGTGAGSGDDAGGTGAGSGDDAG